MTYEKREHLLSHLADGISHIDLAGSGLADGLEQKAIAEIIAAENCLGNVLEGFPDASVKTIRSEILKSDLEGVQVFT